MAKCGYVRVSTRDQHPESQIGRLIAAGCDRDHIYVDEGVSGKLASRPQWDRCLNYLREGDVLVTVKLDRIGRSLKNLIEVTELLRLRGVDLVVLDQQIDTTTSAGKLIFHVLGAISEFERDLIRDRTMDGLAAARERGRIGGAQPKLNAAQRKRARDLHGMTTPTGKRVHTMAEIGKVFNVSRQTIYRVLESE